MKLSSQVNMALDLLQKSGFEAFIVGGCVRDFIMDKDPKDIDITTSAEPYEVIKIFENYKVIETGLKHGTVTVVINSQPLEITTYRIDGNYSDNRRPDSVRFTRSIKEDLSRRDYTINAIAYNPQNGFIDFFDGRKDITNKILRCVGAPGERFQEDSLRILRGLRFSSALGFEIDKETSQAMLLHKNLLKNISSERIAIEFVKTLMGKNAGKILLTYIDVFGTIVPELLPMKSFHQDTPCHIYNLLKHSVVATENIAQGPYMKLAALLHDIGKPHAYIIDDNGKGCFYGHANVSVRIAENILTRLKFDNFTKQRVKVLIKYHDTPIEPTKKSIKTWLNKLDPEVFFELVELKRADYFAQNTEYQNMQMNLNLINKIAHEIILNGECFSIKDLEIRGNDLMKLGIPKGEEIGKVLNEILDLVIHNKLENKKEIIIDWIKVDWINSDYNKPPD